jgi:glycosyltransferase involved in cell wall biosynthesis
LSEYRLRVGADIGCIVPGPSGGLANVVATALNGVIRRSPDMNVVVFATPLSEELIEVDERNVEMVRFPQDGFYTRLDAELSTRPVDVLFRAFPTLERLSFPLERQIVLIPDLLYEVLPHLLTPDVAAERRAAFGPPLRWAGAIATISHYVRSTITRVPGRTPDVFVMYPSVPEHDASYLSSVSREERALVPDGEFFFYPANWWPHKNHERLIEAVARHRKSTGRATELVLTGALETEDLASLPRNGFVRHLGYVRRPLLRLLYDRALAVTFFSLHEGFGIPLLEAFAAGTPVLCANSTSLPEVAGDAALTCDPRDVDAMARLMDEIVAKPGLRNLLTTRGRQRLDLFSCEGAIAELTAAIDRVHQRSLR